MASGQLPPQSCECLLSHSFGQSGCHGETAAAIAALVTHKMAGTGFFMFDLTVGGNLDSLGETFMCFLFGHLD